MVPNIAQCYAIMSQYGMLDHIKQHSIVVARIAQLLATELAAAGVDISVDKSLAGALLHDIGKTLCLNNGGDHAALGREICHRHRLDDIADIVGEHVRLRGFSPDNPCTEKEVVYYADKRVNHDQIVSLEERMRYILERYGRDNPQARLAIRRNFQVCRLVESKIFRHLPLRPEQLAQML